MLFALKIGRAFVNPKNSICSEVMIKRKIIELVYLWFFIGFKILSYFILIDVIYLKKLFYYRQRKISNAKTCINVVPRKVVWWKILLRHIGHHKIYSRIYICFCSISLILEYYAWVVKQDFQITFYRYNIHICKL